ncbi:hypothetical protein J6590_066610 [Homalodisca vitripennis]|nr:hypothetical protein J6590_066610 [Homalodisca vitripennis]
MTSAWGVPSPDRETSDATGYQRTLDLSEGKKSLQKGGCYRLLELWKMEEDVTSLILRATAVRSQFRNSTGLPTALGRYPSSFVSEYSWVTLYIQGGRCNKPNPAGYRSTKEEDVTSLTLRATAVRSQFRNSTGLPTALGRYPSSFVSEYSWVTLYIQGGRCNKPNPAGYRSTKEEDVTSLTLRATAVRSQFRNSTGLPTALGRYPPRLYRNIVGEEDVTSLILRATAVRSQFRNSTGLPTALGRYPSSFVSEYSWVTLYIQGGRCNKPNPAGYRSTKEEDVTSLILRATAVRSQFRNSTGLPTALGRYPSSFVSEYSWVTLYIQGGRCNKPNPAGYRSTKEEDVTSLTLRATAVRSQFRNSTGLPTALGRYPSSEEDVTSLILRATAVRSQFRNSTGLPTALGRYPSSEEDVTSLILRATAVRSQFRNSTGLPTALGRYPSSEEDVTSLILRATAVRSQFRNSTGLPTALGRYPSSEEDVTSLILRATAVRSQFRNSTGLPTALGRYPSSEEDVTSLILRATAVRSQFRNSTGLPTALGRYPSSEEDVTSLILRATAVRSQFRNSTGLPTALGRYPSSEEDVTSLILRATAVRSQFRNSTGLPTALGRYPSSEEDVTSLTLRATAVRSQFRNSTGLPTALGRYPSSFVSEYSWVTLYIQGGRCNKPNPAGYRSTKEEDVTSLILRATAVRSQFRNSTGLPTALGRYPSSFVSEYSWVTLYIQGGRCNKPNPAGYRSTKSVPQ